MAAATAASAIGKRFVLDWQLPAGGTEGDIIADVLVLRRGMRIVADFARAPFLVLAHVHIMQIGRAIAKASR